MKIQRGKVPSPKPVAVPSRASAPVPPLEALKTGFEGRSIDGRGNNLAKPEWGAAGAPLQRLTTVSYQDGASIPAGAARPGARTVSNGVVAQEESVANPAGASDLFWVWGQFLDHDLGRTVGAKPVEPLPISVPAGDPHFDPKSAGTAELFFSRSQYVVDADGIRQQLNSLTAFIDASQVYGSDPQTAALLRKKDGTGQLITGEGNLLPRDPRTPDAPYFLAGDGRVNENVLLSSVQTVFLREHNRIAAELGTLDSFLSDEERYQMARALVAAQIQHITYSEFLPKLLGPDALSAYAGYREDVNPGLDNFFSAAAYRLGHSMVSSELKRLGPDGQPIAQGPLDLVQAFNNPKVLVEEGGIDPLLRGAAAQTAQAIDPKIVTPLRNLLFGGSGSGGMDLAAINIQRGRDHGLPSYNQARVDHGLTRLESFSEVTLDEALQQRLAATYPDVDSIDAWVGALCEAPAGGGQVGPLLRAALKGQFERSRDGDRFWYQHRLAPEVVTWVEGQRLSDVIRRNSGVGAELQDDVFDAR